MSAKHTPGPWIYKRNDVTGDCDHIATVAWCEAYCIGRDCGDGYSRNYEHHGHAEDDARLIAAAPELLALLMEARQELNAEPEMWEFVSRIDAAIAKASWSAA